MNMKKKLGDFLTMTRKANHGFTLVELIVVIAILAILAGVAIPVYSGYIAKADRAADEQLLSALNTAFASACAINGESNYGRGDVTLSNAKIVNGEFVYEGPFATEFADFYEGGTFEVITGVIYDPTFGGFKDFDTFDELTLSYGGGTITVSREVIQAMQNSTFGSVMGGEALLNEITGLTNLMASGNKKMSEELLADTAQGGYMQKYAAYLGVEGADTLTGDDLIAAVEEKLVETYTANGIVVDETNAEEMVNSAMVNGMVFYAAEGMKSYTVETATAFLNSENIYTSLSSNNAEKMAQASLVYGMYAGFVNSEYNTGNAQLNSNDPMAAIEAVSGENAHAENFQAYLDSEQGKADVKAYMEAMDVINDASGNDAAASVLVKGFEDSELETLLIGVLGK